MWGRIYFDSLLDLSLLYARKLVLVLAHIYNLFKNYIILSKYLFQQGVFLHTLGISNIADIQTALSDIAVVAAISNSSLSPSSERVRLGVSSFELL